MTTTDTNGATGAWVHAYRSIIAGGVAVIIAGGGWFLSNSAAKQDRMIEKLDQINGQAQTDRARIDVLWSNDLRFDAELGEHAHRITVVETRQDAHWH